MESLVERAPWLFTRLPVPLADLFCDPFKVVIDARTFDPDVAEFSNRDLQALIGHLSELPDVEILHIDSVPITDAGLEGIHVLRLTGGLSISNCPVTDAGAAHLHGLNDAGEIWLVGTEVTSNGCQSLQRALPGCRIFFDPDGSAGPEEQFQFYAEHAAE
jgi:hypothetical protein